MKALILAGGGGTRLWPVSRKGDPKQVQAIIGRHSLLQATYARLRRGFAVSDIYVAVGAAHARAVRRQLPRLPRINLIVEPCRRDTAAAIGFALLQISRREPHDTFVVINSDAHVRDVPAYLRSIRAAGRLVERHPGFTALIGIRPEYPETGYGYIRVGRPFDQLRLASGRPLTAFRVGRFVEKPPLAKARRFLADGGYLWNPTLVVGRIDHFLKLFDEHLPRQAALFAAMRRAFGRPDERRQVARLFARLPAVSIDYGILEKEKRLLVIPADFGWADIGHWRAVHEILEADPASNVVRGRHVGVNSRGNLILSYSGKLVATAGVCDMIIVDTGDIVLVCPKDRAQDVKHLVAGLAGNRRLKRYL